MLQQVGALRKVLSQQAIGVLVRPERIAQRHRVLVGCASASMRYHDEIRVFSRLMAKSAVGNNQ
jgi:hypothetical protein